MQKDNPIFEQKKRLRLVMLRKVEKPVVMETHGGIGKLYASCYSTVPAGVVFERDPAKADFLAQQRPRWAVYRCDVVRALRAGAGSHLEINFLDIDAYGSPWETVGGYFASQRKFSRQMMIVANDGLRQAVRMRHSWAVKALNKSVEKYGGDSLFKRYKEVCREMLADRVIAQGYVITGWTSYYTGASHLKDITHWAALLEKR